MPATPSAQVLPVNGLINYQEGSIVSRVMLKSEAGNVTLFAFDLGQELSEHSTPYDALVQVLDGEANDPHAVKAVKQFKMLLTMLK